MGIANDIHNAISAGNIRERDADFPFRHHLGASLLGHTCARYLWYSFRWFRLPSHSARIQRIFEKGRREETLIIETLRSLGYVISTTLPELCENMQLPVTLNSIDVMRGWGLNVYKPMEMTADAQIKANFPPHLGGSMDGILHVPQNYVDQYGFFMVLEIKTHNQKSFREVIKNGESMQLNKAQHYIQGNAYATQTGCTNFMYVAKNKNDEQLYLREEVTQPYITQLNIIRAEQIIYKQSSSDTAKTQEKWRCSSCDYRAICKDKNTDLIHRNCRTCVNAVATPDGSWRCEAFGSFIPKYDEITKAEQCTQYERIT